MLTGGAGATFGAETSYAVGDGPRSVAIGDFDLDGDRDLVVTNSLSASISVLLNNGTGSFGAATGYATGNSPQSVAVGDLNGDGDPDLAITTNVVTGNVEVREGGAGAAFGAPSFFTAGSQPSGITIANFDGDGDLDIAVTNRNSGDVLVLRNAGLTTFGGYPRPKGATPIYASLVPAFAPCAAPNRVHAAPLAFGSCSPVQQASGELTVGAPDANGRTANATGSVRFNVFADNPATTADEADVSIQASVTDVRRQSDLADYAGELRLSASVRITDKSSTPGPVSGTAQDTSIAATVPCSPTVATTIGSTCTVSTSEEALMPGAVTGGARSVWQLGRVDLYDGGPDADGDTTADNTLFMTQGVFAP